MLFRNCFVFIFGVLVSVAVSGILNTSPLLLYNTFRDGFVPEVYSMLSGTYILRLPRKVVVPSEGKRKICLNIQVEIPICTYGRIVPIPEIIYIHNLDVIAETLAAGKVHSNICVGLINRKKFDLELTKGHAIAFLIVQEYVIVRLQHFGACFNADHLQNQKLGTSRYKQSFQSDIKPPDITNTNTDSHTDMNTYVTTSIIINAAESHTEKYTDMNPYVTTSNNQGC